MQASRRQGLGVDSDGDLDMGAPLEGLGYDPLDGDVLSDRGAGQGDDSYSEDSSDEEPDGGFDQGTSTARRGLRDLGTIRV